MSTETREYRPVAPGEYVCSTCDEKVRVLASSFALGKRPEAQVHGPRQNRCPGSRQQVKPWLEATRLPTWDELTDLDKGAALLHLWKRFWEGARYAVEHYPARYYNHPMLIGLDTETASRHAATLLGKWSEAIDKVGGMQVDRLYDLALAADRERSVPASSQS